MNIYNVPNIGLLLARLDTVIDREVWFTANTTQTTQTNPDEEAITFYKFKTPPK